MVDAKNDGSSRQQRLDGILGDYLQRIDQGESIDPKQFISEHPDLADELTVFFQTAARVDEMAGPVDETSTAGIDRNAPTGADPMARQEVAPLGTIRYFGDYELVEEIARGGMGVVYKARQVSLNRIVAVKMILSGQLASSEDVQRFLAEAEAAANLLHPGIVAIHEVGKHDDQHYFSMDYIEGISLAELVRDNPLPARRAAEYVKTIAEAIHYAHQQGTLHRDLKPSNILIDQSDNPRITDFGLAKRVEGDSGMTATGQVLGTPSYMSPEQASGNRGEIGPSSDVYSLGAILYELLTGRPPFQAATPLDTLMLVLESEPAPPRQLNPMVPRDLETICLKCLEKNPAHRYLNAADLAADLHRWLVGEAILARSVSLLERLWRWCKRKPVVAGLSAAVFVSLVAGATVSTTFSLRAIHQRDLTKGEKLRADRAAAEAIHARNQAENQKEAAIRNVYRAEMILASKEWNVGDVAQLRDLLAQWVPKQGRWNDLRGFEWFYFDASCNSDLLTLNPVIDSSGRGAFSPDGRYFAVLYYDQQHVLAVWDVAATDAPAIKVDSTSEFDFSTDSKRLVSLDSDGELKLWDLAAGKELHTIRTGKHTARVRFGADDRHVISASTTEIEVWDVATGMRLHTFEVRADPMSCTAFSLNARLFVHRVKNSGTVKVVDIEANGAQRTLEGSVSPFSSTGPTFVFNSTGDYLAAADSEGIKLWELSSGRLLHTLKMRTNDVVFSPDSRLLVSRSLEHGALRRITIWNLDTPKDVFTIQTDDDVWRIAFSPDGGLLAAQVGGNVQFWDPTTRTPLQRLNVGGSLIGLSPDGRRLVSGGPGGIKFWDLTGERQGPPVGRERGTLQGSAELIDNVSFSPDHRLLAAATKRSKKPQAINLWDSTNGLKIRSIQVDNDEMTRIVFSPAGTHVAALCRDSEKIEGGFQILNVEIKLWDTNTGRRFRTLSHQFEKGFWDLSYIGFGNGGRSLAGAGELANKGNKRRGMIRLWNLQSGDVMHTLEHEGTGRYTSSPNGDLIAWATAYSDDPPMVKVWNVTSGRLLHTLKVNVNCEKNVNVAFSPNGRYLVLANNPGQVQLWDPNTGRQLSLFTSHKADSFYGRRMTFHPASESQQLALAGENGIQLWDMEKGRLIRTLDSEIGNPIFSSDGRLIAGINQNAIGLWNVESGARVCELDGHGYLQNSLSFIDDNRCIAVTTNGVTHRLWELSPELQGHRRQPVAQDSRTVRMPNGDVADVAFSANGTVIATAKNGSVTLWDSVTLKKVRTLKSAEDFRCLAFSRDGRFLATGSEDGVIVLWTPDTGEELLSLQGHTGQIRSVAFSHDCRRVASSEDAYETDAMINVWDAETGRELATIGGLKRGVGSVAFNSDGTQIASAGNVNDIFNPDEDPFGQITFWDAATGQKLRTINGHDGIHHIVYSPDGTMIATAGYDEKIVLWDVATGKEKLTLKGHSDMVQSVAFNPDGRRLASGGDDGTVKLWDTMTGQELLTLNEHNGPVCCVAFSSDGHRLVSGSEDGTVKVWDARPVTRELRLERQALSVVRFVLDHNRLSLAEAIKQIEGDQTISDAVRQKALQFANHWHMDTTESTHGAP